MKKRLVVAMVLFNMILSMTLSYGKPMNHMVEKDVEIEWNSYREECLI